MSDAPSWLNRLATGALDEVVEVQAGSLVVKGDRLVACDPLVFLEGSEPFAHEVTPGERPVFVGRIEGEIAYARVELGEGDIEAWEVARAPGEEDVEEWPGYTVEAGVGAFVDLTTVQAFLQVEEALAEEIREKLREEGLTDPMSPEFEERFEALRAAEGDDPLADLDTALRKKDHASVMLAGGGNVVAFKSGAGNGIFVSFWGLDASSKAVALVTDFGLLDEAEDDLADLEGLGEEGLGALEGELSDMGGLEALAAALGMEANPEPEARQGPSPLFLQARDLLKRWVKEEKIELEPEVNIDDFAEAFLYKLSSLQGQRNPGAFVGEWLVDRREVADVFATDDELEADLTG